MIPGEPGVPLVIRGLIKMSPKPGNTRLYRSSAGVCGEVGRYLANGAYCLLEYFKITSVFLLVLMSPEEAVVLSLFNFQQEH